jgi:hypothetical protein
MYYLLVGTAVATHSPLPLTGDFTLHLKREGFFFETS